MKTLEAFFYPVLKCLYFGKQLLSYLSIFLSAFFRQRASLGCELVALRSQLTFYKETIHGHLVLLGFDPPCPDTIRKYMVQPTGGADKSQTWLTFLRNHMPVSWGMDFFTVRTLRFQILYVFVILSPSRRRVVHFGVAA